MKYLLGLLFLFNTGLAISQEKTIEISLSDGLKVIDYRFHQTGAFSVFKKGKKENTSVYTIVDDNLDILTYTSAEKMKVPDEYLSNPLTADTAPRTASNLSMFFSHTGKNILYKKLRNYFIWNTKEFEFSDMDINGDIEENPIRKLSEFSSSIDFLSKEFVTDKHFLSIGRKEGWSNFNRRNYADTDFFLYHKELETLKEDYHKLVINDDCCDFISDPKLLYFDENRFLLSYALHEDAIPDIIKRSKEKIKVYRVITYNYKAEVLGDRIVEIKRPSKSEAFRVARLGDNSTYYHGERGADLNHAGSTLFTTESMAQLNYSKNEDAFYSHSILKLEEKDDAFMLQKFDTNGTLLWNTFQNLPDFKLHNFNRNLVHVFVDITKNFVALSLYPYSTQEHLKFYVIDKNTGEIINQKEIGTYKNKRVNRFLNTKTNEYSGMILKEEFSEKLTLDKNSYLACLYDSNYKEFIEKISDSEDGYTLLSHFTENGIITVVKPENNEKLLIHKFSLK